MPSSYVYIQYMLDVIHVLMMVNVERHSNQLIFNVHISGCNAALSRPFGLLASASEPLV